MVEPLNVMKPILTIIGKKLSTDEVEIAARAESNTVETKATIEITKEILDTEEEAAAEFKEPKKTDIQPRMVQVKMSDKEDKDDSIWDINIDEVIF